MKKSMFRLHGMKLPLVKPKREWMMVLKKLWIGILRKRISEGNLSENSNPDFCGKRLGRRSNILRETGWGLRGLTVCIKFILRITNQPWHHPQHVAGQRAEIVL